MTLISSIIVDAFRESNILPLSKQPNADQSAEALRLYNQILASIYGGDAGEPLVDWPLGTFGRDNPYILPYNVSDARLFSPLINSRLIASNAAGVTVFFTDCPQDGARYGIADPFGRLAAFPVTLDANGRTIEGAAALVFNVNGTFREWIYRADLAAWLRVNDVISTGENPFPAKFDGMFVILLAMRLNPRYGRMLDDQSVAVLKAGKREFLARYLQSAPLQRDASISWPFMSVQGYSNGAAFGSSAAFDRGDVLGV